MLPEKKEFESLVREKRELGLEIFARDGEDREALIGACKSAYMCNDSNTNTTSDGVGRFRLDVGSIADYGVGPISCNVSIGASCEG